MLTSGYNLFIFIFVLFFCSVISNSLATTGNDDENIDCIMLSVF